MRKWNLPPVSPWILIGVLLILVPIFTLMTLDRLKRQKEFSTQRLMERGVALIRTFEAGTRTGMLTRQWGANRIQAMLYETALQPEILYMMITTREGKIIAHSDPSRVGVIADAMPDLNALGSDTGTVSYRILGERGDQSFELYKRFVPIRDMKHGPGWMMRGFKRRGMHMDHGRELGRDHGRGRTDNGESRSAFHMKEWTDAYMKHAGPPDLSSGNPETGPVPEMEHYIFAGLSMKKINSASHLFVRNTIWRGIFFLILGSAGVVALFAFQAYRNARVSLNRVKAFSDRVIHHMPSGLVTIRLDYTVSSMNRAARDILSRNIKKAPSQWVELIEEISQSGEAVSREMPVEIGGEKSLLLDINASPITDSDGKLSGFLFLFRDMTQVKDLKKQVETNKRLAAIGKLAAGVAHEIRNPLSSIKGFATYFGKRYPDNDTDRQTAQVMVSEVERINQSITQLLEFAKPMAVEKKQVNIRQMIEHSLKLVQYDLDKKQIQADVRLDTGISELFTDGGRINQVLLNLYINAIQAMEEGGTLEIRVAQGDSTGWLEISVSDTGCGIDPELQDRIFDPYFTTRPTGTGLGLSIVHRIVENLSGKIWMESNQGRGSCFTISLPLGAPEQDTEEAGK